MTAQPLHHVHPHCCNWLSGCCRAINIRSGCTCSVLQPTTRLNVARVIQRPAKVALDGLEEVQAASPAPGLQGQDMRLRTYKNNSRMKRTAVSIMDMHTEQQARRKQDADSYSGQEVTYTAENKPGILPDTAVADELVSWYASCLRGLYIKAVRHVPTRPPDRRYAVALTGVSYCFVPPWWSAMFPGLRSCDVCCLLTAVQRYRPI